MKKAVYAIGLVMEVALLGGAVILDYFSRARLGMSRWLGYHNQKWESALPLHALEVLAVVVLIVLFVASLVMFARIAEKRRAPCASIVASGLLLCVFVWFIAFHSVSTMKAFYLMAACLFLAALLQVVQSLVLARFARNRE